VANVVDHGLMFLISAKRRRRRFLHHARIAIGIMEIA
jgi:hypothetical protein